MRKIGLALSLVVALALPGTAFAHNGQGPNHNRDKAPAKFCKQLRADMTAADFQQAFGKNASKRNAFGKCVSMHARGIDLVRAFAKRQCRRTLGEDADGSELRSCVAKKVKQAAQQEADQISAAVGDCRDELASDPEGFATRYGTNHNKRNAFGKCVSSHAREGNHGGRGDETGDGNGGDEGDDEGDDDQPGQDDAPGQDDIGQEDPGQPDQGDGTV